MSAAVELTLDDAVLADHLAWFKAENERLQSKIEELEDHIEELLVARFYMREQLACLT
jgi:hypothetical protein